MQPLEPAIILDGSDPGLAWLPPIVPLALGMALGGACSGLAGPDPVLCWWLIGVPLLALCLLWRRLGFGHAVGWSILVAAVILGRLWAPAYPTEETPARLISAEVRVEAVYSQRYNQRIALRLQDCDLPQTRFFAKAPLVPPVQVDDRMVIDGLWHVQWDAWRQEWIPSIQVKQLRDHRPRSLGPRGWAWAVIDRIAVQRDLAAALLLGQERPVVGRSFRNAGLAHLLAVSGFHLGVVLAGLAGVLHLLRCSWFWRQCLVVTVAVAYLWLTASPIPTQRAVVMCLAVVVAGLGGRSIHPLASVSLAALILLIIEPADGQRLGFQLSLAAVLGIVTLGRDLVLARSRLPLDPWPLDRPAWRGMLWLLRRLIDGLAIGFAATLATAPILAVHIGVANPWSMIATIIATPLLMLVLLAGLPLLLLAGTWPAGPWSGLFVLCETGLQTLASLAEWIATWPGSRLFVTVPPWWVLALWPLLFWPCQSPRFVMMKPIFAGILIIFWHCFS